MSKKYKYAGKDVQVTWNKTLCIHMGECGRAQGDIFKGGRDPWCEPDVAAIADVADVIERCPTGALAYDATSKTEQVADKNTVHIAYNGPLFFKGELQIDGADENMPGVQFRAALCRCGLSKSKPFCDNSHVGGKFIDFGAVGILGQTIESVGGPLKVTPAKNGPIHVAGNVHIYASSGRLAWQGNDAYLCRCGQSKNKPFCDGSHKAAGFES